MFHRVELEIQNSFFLLLFLPSLTLEPSSPFKNLEMEPSEMDHHHQLQRREHLQGFAAAAAPPAWSTTPHDAGSNHAWKYSSCLLLKDDDPTTPNRSGALPSPPAYPKQGYEALLPPPPPLGTSMVHDLGLHWPCTSAAADTFQGHFARAAEELPDSFLKLSRFGAAVWNPPAGEQHSPSTGKYEQAQVPSPDVDVELLSHSSTDRFFQLPTRASRHQELPSPSSSSCTTVGGGETTAFERLGTYTKMLLAATNTPSSSPRFPGSFSMQELEALELLASARFGAQMASRQPSLGNVAFFGEGVAYGNMGHLPAPSQGGPASNEPQKMSSSLPDGVKEGKKRSANGGPDHYRASPAPVAKKARPEPRSSSASPLKVRKEKLGDRVAALQQLVAPFGKTDTASVLTEAVGYIKFLQEQVQTLSMPYLRSSSKNKIRTAQGVPNEEKDETKQDLRSRGLCLVPLSYTSYFTGDSGSSSTAWSSPSYFRGN